MRSTLLRHGSRTPEYPVWQAEFGGIKKGGNKRMRTVIAFDAWKGSLSSLQAGKAAAEGVKKGYPGAEVVVKTLADGGEGTVEVLTGGMGGRMERLTVTGPLGAPVSCMYGVLEATKTAVIEMAAAAGLTLVSEQERNPLITTTYGVGEIIADAIQKGCRRFIVGIGGSATNDGGVGMLQALGFDFRDAEGKQIPFGAAGLEKLAEINAEHVISELRDCTFQVACDVKNPLCGPFGSSAVYGPQKGADAAAVERMDAWLSAYAKLAKRSFPRADSDMPGAGAAGGLGFAFYTFLNASLESGVSIILKETGLQEAVREADIVITGEGRLDGQTAMGKTPIGVARLAKKYGKTVIAFAGSAAEDARICNESGIDAFFPVLRETLGLKEAMRPECAAQNLTASVEQVFRLLHAAAGKQDSEKL